MTLVKIAQDRFRSLNRLSGLLLARKSKSQGEKGRRGRPLLDQPGSFRQREECVLVMPRSSRVGVSGGCFTATPEMAFAVEEGTPSGTSARQTPDAHGMDCTRREMGDYARIVSDAPHARRLGQCSGGGRSMACGAPEMPAPVVRPPLGPSRKPNTLSRSISDTDNVTCSPGRS